MYGLPDGVAETVTELIPALASEEVLIEDVLRRTKRRHGQWEPSINAFTQLSAGVTVAEMRNTVRHSTRHSEQTLAFLREVEEEHRRTGVHPPPQRPLRDVPVAIKDLFDAVVPVDWFGTVMETTGCSEAYRGNVPWSDSPIVSRLKSAGLLISGKTNQHELAAGGTNLVSARGRTCNPWDPTRMTGGSSGGSAAAVVAGIVPWSVGSDTGGSIRIPASMCGTYGLKPTTGHLPTQGMMPLAPSMDCPGPFAMTVADLWTLYRVLLADDPLEPPPSRDRSEPFRIGVPDGFFADLVHDDTRAVVQQVGGQLKEAGAFVAPSDGRGIEGARRTWMRVCSCEFAFALPNWRMRRDGIAPSVLEWLDMGDVNAHIAESPPLSDEYEAANTRREEIRQWFESRLEGVDALLVPTTAYPAPRADQETVDLGAAGTVRVDEVGPGYMTCSVNLAGLPAMNIPAGWSSEGMPIGVSLIGHRDAEPTLFAIASLWEQATGYRPRRPPPPQAQATP